MTKPTHRNTVHTVFRQLRLRRRTIFLISIQPTFPPTWRKGYSPWKRLLLINSTRQIYLSKLSSLLRARVNGRRETTIYSLYFEDLCKCHQNSLTQSSTSLIKVKRQYFWANFNILLLKILDSGCLVQKHWVRLVEFRINFFHKRSCMIKTYHEGFFWAWQTVKASMSLGSKVLYKHMSDWIDFIWDYIFEELMLDLAQVWGKSWEKAFNTFPAFLPWKFFLAEKCVHRWCELLALVFLTTFLHSHWHTHICFYAFTHKQAHAHTHTHTHARAHTLSIA